MSPASPRFALDEPADLGGEILRCIEVHVVARRRDRYRPAARQRARELGAVTLVEVASLTPDDQRGAPDVAPLVPVVARREILNTPNQDIGVERRP